VTLSDDDGLISEFQTEGALTLKVFANNTSAMRRTRSNSISVDLKARKRQSLNPCSCKIKPSQRLYYCAPKRWPESWPTLSATHWNN